MEDPIKIETGKMAPPGSPQLVGKRIPGLSQGVALGMLKGEPVPEAEVQKAVQGSQVNHPDLTGHVPQIGALASPQDAWGVFCARCSAESSDYIYPCKIDPSDWPPQVLVPYFPSVPMGAPVTDE